MRKGLHGKHKIILYFLVGIALPCLLLSYLALRGIRNDRALYQQRRLEENNRRSQRVIRTLRDQLADTERVLDQTLAVLQSFTQSEAIDTLKALKSRLSLVDEFFWLRPTTGTVDVVTATLLFSFSVDSLKPNYTEFTSPIPAFQTAQEHEFQKQSLDQAIHHYKQALAQTRQPQQKALILNALARAQKKAHLFQEALQSYQTLEHDYGHLFSAYGIPHGLAAQVEAGSLAGALKDTVTAAQNFLNAFNELLDGVWSLDKSAYQFWSSALKDSLNKVLSPDTLLHMSSPYRTFQKLAKLEETRMRMTERLLTFQARAGRELVEANLSRPMANQQLSFAWENYKYDISLLPAWPGINASNQMVTGIIWCREAIKEALMAALYRENFAGDYIYWRVVAEDNQEIAKIANFSGADSPLLMKTPLSNNFPAWTLEFYQGNPNLIENLLMSRRSIYFYIFVLIAGILGFGLVISLRSVAHEMELVKIKSDFVSTISHEFKSPLTSIRQLTEMLQTGRVPSQERRQKYYDVILEQGEKLSLLIDNILDFSRMEEGRRRFDFQSTDLAVLLRNVVATFQQRVLPQGFELNLELIEPLPAIKVDRLALIQAVNNLLDNAIKFSNNNKIVQVRVLVQEPYLNISVQDSGIGIKDTEVRKIFDRFYRSGDENTRMSIRGSGLGLTLVKQIITAHNGRIRVESKLGQGSTFTIQLPISEKA